MPSKQEIEESAKSFIEKFKEIGLKEEFGLEFYRHSAVLMKAALEAAEKVRNEWMSIETAPKDGTKILAINEEDVAVVYWYNGYPHCEGVWFIAESEHSSYIPEVIYMDNPKEWMHIPTNTNDTSETVSNENKDNES